MGEYWGEGGIAEYEASGILIFIVSQGIDFSKERKLGRMDKTGRGQLESEDDIEAKGQERERIAHWLKSCSEVKLENEPRTFDFSQGIIGDFGKNCCSKVQR